MVCKDFTETGIRRSFIDNICKSCCNFEACEKEIKVFLKTPELKRADIEFEVNGLKYQQSRYFNK